MQEHDRETRDRLLEAAARLFAERGFSKVTVRDICNKARANVAAVNYHFAGKTGLYQEVLQAAIRTMQSTTEAARQAGARRPPQQQLEAYVSVLLQRVFEGRDSWIHQLMMRELADPTPALDMVMDQVIRPRMAYLAGVIAVLLDSTPDDARVGNCVFSVQAQCQALMAKSASGRLERRSAAQVQTMARHIACFSLGGIRAMAAPPRSG